MTTTIELCFYLDKKGVLLRDTKLTEASTRLRELDKPDCVWTYDMDQSMYDTSCGEAWRFDEGFLKDHSIKFCPFCAGQVKEST